MKLVMQASDLAEMVNVCGLAISSRPMRPINECVYLQARQGQGIPMLTMIGKDMGIGIQKVTDRVTVMEDGEALIPAKTLLGFLKLMDGEVTLTVDEKNQATLKSKGKKVNILCMDGAEFEPGLTEIEKPHECKMNGLDYGTLVNSVAHCVATDTGRMVLTGINFTFDGTKSSGSVETCGLDGFRMAICRKNADTNDQFSALVPGTSAKLVQKVIGVSEDVSFRFGSGVMIAEAYDTAIEVALLAGEYMDYNKMVKRDATMRMKLSTKELLNAVKIAMISAVEAKNNLIVFHVRDEETLEVSAMNDKSAAVTAIPCMVEGQMADGNEIAFDGRFVEDCLKAQMGYGDEAILDCKNGVAPMDVMPSESNDFFQLVLPVRRSA